MIPIAVEEVARLCPGRLDARPWAAEVTGVEIDSRRIGEGDLFVAVRGGVDFVRHALARGAAAALVPDDPHGALAALGRAVRDRWTGQAVAITGSTGKTSTKDILGALCSPHRRTVVARASYNNELGVPLTLCLLEHETEICVLELAMRGFGQIAELAGLARPTAGVITNIAPVHLELVGSLDGVARAKAELLDALPAGAPALVPAVASELEPYLRPDLDYLRVGRDVRLERFDPPELVADVLGTRVALEVPFAARHQADNAVTALGAYAALGLPLTEAAAGAAQIRFSPLRGEELPLPGGGSLINDCWNANQVSVRAALEDLAARAAGRRTVAVLGGMAELGEESPRYHREVGEAVAASGVDVVLTVGDLARGYLGAIPEARPVETVAEAVDALRELLRDGDCVLVKGSRALGLERIAEALLVPERV